MAVFAQTDQSDRVWLYHLERWHCHFSHQMSSNGLESLGDMGPGTTECRNSICVFVQLGLRVNTRFCPPQPTYPMHNAYRLLWPRPSLSATTQPLWWRRAPSCRKAPAARHCRPCSTRFLCPSTWTTATAMSWRTNWTVCWTASPTKLVMWVMECWEVGQKYWTARAELGSFLATC